MQEGKAEQCASTSNPQPAAEPILLYSASARPEPVPIDPNPVHTVDLNYASRAELEALPGIGAVRAASSRLSRWRMSRRVASSHTVWRRLWRR